MEKYSTVVTYKFIHPSKKYWTRCTKMEGMPKFYEKYLDIPLANCYNMIVLSIERNSRKEKEKGDERHEEMGLQI